MRQGVKPIRSIEDLHGEFWPEEESVDEFLAWVRAIRREMGLRSSDMDITFTAVYQKVPEGYIGFIEELPGANTQGATLEEARANLKEAVELVMEANRALAEESVKDVEVIREQLS